jgi:nitrate reductase NapE component
MSVEKKKAILPFFLFLFFLIFTVSSFAQEPGFTQEDRERLVRVEATLKVFMEQVDKRFEQVDRRFAELREDMNKRFEQMMTFLWILVAIFTTLTAVVIGFAYWDRRTIIRKARDEAIEAIEREGKLTDLIKALRQLASEDKKVRDVLRSFGLL